ncbi:MAG: UDP-glucose/GDP-mannose dehydrogenase family protein [Caldilineales bacterium]|nr:UDP-glucose/GDP-mannose dehydrogenase family protein [Caldilineales bacterium]MDW8318367.1 UDP-glucose/GDP-mannose dehydrogenase family protein [Anaerolineae bacterium]
MKNICVIGTGYVGLVTGTCFADLGNRVVCVDINEEKIASLRAGKMPIYEPGLEEMVERNVRAGRLFFTTSYEEGLDGAEFVFIAVGTPSGVDGEADLRYVRMAAEEIARTMKAPLIIINKSTVPVGTGDWVADIISRNQPKPIEFAVVSNPEFLREGNAISDFLNPDRVVLGSLNKEAAEKVAQLHLALRAPIMVTDLRTAEMIKYASNAFLATRISFINEIAAICEELGADVKEVAAGMGYDKRIGRYFLDAGLGYGGSCFPKDVLALEHMALVHGTHPALLRAVMDINRDQRRKVIRRLRSELGGLRDCVVGLLGLAFKPNTDDMREAPAVEIAHLLRNEGAIVKGYDPVAMPVAARELPEVRLAKDPYDLAEGCDAIVVCTEWNEFRHLDMQRVKRAMRRPVLYDGRNIYDPVAMTELGFRYFGVGRPVPNAHKDKPDIVTPALPSGV